MAKDEFSVGLLFLVGKIMNEPVDMVNTAPGDVRPPNVPLVSNGILFFITKLAQNPAAKHTKSKKEPSSYNSFVLHKLLP